MTPLTSGWWAITINNSTSYNRDFLLKRILPIRFIFNGKNGRKHFFRWKKWVKIFSPNCSWVFNRGTGDTRKEGVQGTGWRGYIRVIGGILAYFRRRFRTRNTLPFSCLKRIVGHKNGQCEANNNINLGLLPGYTFIVKDLYLASFLSSS